MRDFYDSQRLTAAKQYSKQLAQEAERRLQRPEPVVVELANETFVYENGELTEYDYFDPNWDQWELSDAE